MTNVIRVMMIRLLIFAVCNPCFNFLGADASANRRTNRQSVWARFVGTNRGDPLYLQHRYPRTQSQQIMDLGAQSQPRYLRRKR